MKIETRTNRHIKEDRVVLIDEAGNNCGEISTRDALKKAQESNLDLVEVNSGKVPICRIMDYGKWKYEQEKRRRTNNSQRKQQVKEIKFRPTTGHNDLVYRAKQVDNFITDGNKVKLVVKFKGREQEHMFKTGMVLLDKFLDMLKSNYGIEDQARAEESSINVMLIPGK